jgi:hypothetical protein
MRTNCHPLQTLNLTYSTAPMSEALWFYFRDQQDVVGPLSAEGLKALAASNEISPETPVCREGTESWISYSEAFPPETPSISAANHEAVVSPEVRFLVNGCAVAVIIVSLFLIAFYEPPPPSDFARTEERIKRERIVQALAKDEVLLKEVERFNADTAPSDGHRRAIEKQLRELEKGLR